MCALANCLQRILALLASGMGPDDLRQCLEFCREWNTNAKTSYAAQAMLHAILQHHPPQVSQGRHPPPWAAIACRAC